MPTRIDRLVIFGDSMSDIGNKRISGFGRIARAIGAMRTNGVGRFSDRRNWTDFLWEWAGGASLIDQDASHSEALTGYHRKIGKASQYGAPSRAAFSYGNYAVGGAMGASDRMKIGLDYFKDQYSRYKTESTKYPTTGNTLHIVWFGLNDLVTNNRNNKKMAPVAAEMRLICQKIQQRVRGSHFMFINLPNPEGAVRFMEEIGDKEFAQNKDKREGAVSGFHHGVLEFNFALAGEVGMIQPGGHGTLVDIYTPMQHVNDNLDLYKLRRGSQPHGVKIDFSKYGGVSSDSNYVATSDKAHPSEAVYRIMAQIISSELLKHYDLGTLRENANANFDVL